MINIEILIQKNTILSCEYHVISTIKSVARSNKEITAAVKSNILLITLYVPIVAMFNSCATN